MELPGILTRLEELTRQLRNLSGGFPFPFTLENLEKQIELIHPGNLEPLNILRTWFSGKEFKEQFPGLVNDLEGFRKLQLHISLSEIFYIEEIHQKLKNELDFDENYQPGWHSFRMQIGQPERMPLILTFKNYYSFSTVFPGDSEVLEEIIEDYNQNSTGKKITLVR